MRLRTFLFVPTVLALISIAGCASQPPAPAVPPNISAANAPQTAQPNPATSAPAQLQTANYTARGRIRQLNYADDGRLDGFLLEDGTLIDTTGQLLRHHPTAKNSCEYLRSTASFSARTHGDDCAAYLTSCRKTYRIGDRNSSFRTSSATAIRCTTAATVTQGG